MPLPIVATPIIGKATSVVTGALKKIFGGKDYISAKIGAFGGGGKRNLAEEPPEYLTFHYDRVIKRLGYESLFSPNESQRSTFWKTWDATHPSDKSEWMKTYGHLFETVARIEGKAGGKTNWLMWGGIGLGVVVILALLFFTLRRK